MSDTLNLPNSIWPNGMITNSDDCDVFSPLGTIKVAVPTSSSGWPKGDKLISPFVYDDGKLVGFIDTKALTVSNNTMICLPYEHIEAEFSAIKKGQLQIHAPNAITKKASWKDSGVEDIPEVQFKYKGCKTNTNVQALDANYQTTDIVNGVWSEPLWDLTKGDRLFYNCANLIFITSDLPNLTEARNMFNGCSNLESFSSDLSSLTQGSGMFGYCENLTSFTSKLSKLTFGHGMFAGCKLDAASIKHLIDTIKTYSSNLTLGMGCDATIEDKDLFAQEVGYADMTSLLAALQAKGWTVEAQYNGRPTSTYSLRRPSEDTLPIFAKLEEVEELADYTSLDDSKKFRLTWFHETTGSTDGYTQFNSLEEAIAHFNIKPIERN